MPPASQFWINPLTSPVLDTVHVCLQHLSSYKMDFNVVISIALEASGAARHFLRHFGVKHRVELM